jgi:2-oxoglutarate ferredoxin oxidoreductase subunit gamma
MHEEVIISGFGGQGALFAGQLLTYAGMDEGRMVSWIPSYGPEMRGGTAHCTVIISDEPIGSPIIHHPTSCIVLNPASLEKYEPLVKPGGMLVVNTSLVRARPTRTDIRIVEVPANELADELGNIKMANLVLLGALLRVNPIVQLESVMKALDDHVPQHRRQIIEPNKQALRAGAAVALAQECTVG